MSHVQHANVREVIPLRQRRWPMEEDIPDVIAIVIVLWWFRSGIVDTGVDCDGRL